MRPKSSKKEHYLRTSIEEMLEDGVIERSNAAYHSHPVMVNKTADTYRTCIDYRALNEYIESTSIPLLNIKHLFERIGNWKPDIYGVMDLTAGYHQASLYTPHRIYTAFICFMGVIQFTRLPFGLCRSLSFFQEQMVTMVLYVLIYKCCEIYLDDCIVYGRGEAEFLKNLRSVLKDFDLRILGSKQRNADSVSNV